MIPVAPAGAVAGEARVADGARVLGHRFRHVSCRVHSLWLMKERGRVDGGRSEKGEGGRR